MSRAAFNKAEAALAEFAGVHGASSWTLSQACRGSAAVATLRFADGRKFAASEPTEGAAVAAVCRAATAPALPVA